MTKLKECPRCHGYGEIMTRDESILDSDGSLDIGGTPHPTACRRCNGSGWVKERTRVTITLSEVEERMIDEILESYETKPAVSALFRTALAKHYKDKVENKKEVNKNDGNDST